MRDTICLQLLIWTCLAVLPSATASQESNEQTSDFYEAIIRAPIVPQRDEEAIKSDLENAKKQIQQCDKSIKDAETKVSEAKGWIDTLKKEVDGLNDQIKMAKKEKRDADKLTFEAQKKQLELVEDYLKKMKNVRDGELDLAKSHKDLMNAEAQAYEAELDLRKKADSLKNSRPSDPDLSKLAMEATQAAENTLRLMKTMAGKNADVAGRLTNIADRRVELVQARNKLVTEDRIRKVVEQSQAK
jgi:chromosome segregation ATPase